MCSKHIVFQVSTTYLIIDIYLRTNSVRCVHCSPLTVETNMYF
jgi:hypothetical protein